MGKNGVVFCAFMAVCILAGCDSPVGDDDEGGDDQGAGEDVSPPVVTIIPGDGQADADVNTDITILFSEPVRMISDEEITDLNADDLIVLKQGDSSGPDVSFEADINTAKTAITVNPDFLNGYTSYYIQMSGAEDAHDNAASDTEAVFQTGTGIPEGLVINEIYYDAPDSDQDSGELFIEIYGPPGLDISCFRLKAYNGADGEEYDSKYCEGEIPPDGFYVLAQEEQDYADMDSPFAELQNGPDSLVLYRGTEIADAVGYGSFGEPANFKGEGSSAPDASEGNSITRDSSQTDTDDNSADFTEASPTPGS